MIPTDPPRLAAGFHAVPAGHVAAVVTAFEMLAPPEGLAAPPPRDDLRLERVPAPELAWYRDLFRRIGTDWLWASRLSWHDAKLADTIRHSEVEIWAAIPAGSDAVGLLELDFRDPSACEIAFFGLANGHTGRGAGRWMMQHALARAWSRPGVRRVWVHTCTLDSPAALAFYQRCGFKAYARQVEIMPDPRLNGLLPADAAPDLPVL